MYETVIYEFGSTVVCSGTDCGTLQEIVVEPAATRVAGLVIQSPTDGSHLVPVGMARPAGPDISLDCGRERLAGFPAPVVRNRLVAVGRGDRVRAMDGDAGHVEGVALRPDTGKIVQLLVTFGRWWRRRHVAVPVAVIPGFGPEGVRVLMSRKQVEGLRPVM